MKTIMNSIKICDKADNFPQAWNGRDILENVTKHPITPKEYTQAFIGKVFNCYTKDGATYGDLHLNKPIKDIECLKSVFGQDGSAIFPIGLSLITNGKYDCPDEAPPIILNKKQWESCGEKFPNIILNERQAPEIYGVPEPPSILLERE